MATVQLLASKKDLNAGASYSGGAVPSNGDTLQVVDGSQLVDTNMNALAAINLANYFQSSGFRGRFGVAANPAQFGNVTTLLQVDGGAEQHYIAPGTVAEGRYATSQNGKVWVSTGTHTVAIVAGGEVEFGPACTPAILIVRGGGKAVVRKKSTGSDVTTAVVLDGTLESERTVATLRVLRPTSQVLMSMDAGVSTLLHVAAGRHIHAATGTIVKLEGFGGALSTKGALAPFDITNADLAAGFTVEEVGNLKIINWANQPRNWGYAGGGALKV